MIYHRNIKILIRANYCEIRRLEGTLFVRCQVAQQNGLKKKNNNNEKIVPIVHCLPSILQWASFSRHLYVFSSVM